MPNLSRHSLNANLYEKNIFIPITRDGNTDDADNADFHGFQFYVRGTLKVPRTFSLAVFHRFLKLVSGKLQIFLRLNSKPKYTEGSLFYSTMNFFVAYLPPCSTFKKYKPWVKLATSIVKASCFVTSRCIKRLITS